MEAIAVVLLVLVGACLVVGGLRGLRFGDRYRTCRQHRWKRIKEGGPLVCSQCGWVAGKEPPGDWMMGEGP